jgi:two-component system NtrC family sensor kinase
MQAMPEGGSLELVTRISEKQEQVLIDISDSGCGIPDDELDKIFEPFFTTKERGKGTGLGLSVSYGIIQQHSGEISVASQPGSGTTFSIALPLNGNRLSNLASIQA